MFRRRIIIGLTVAFLLTLGFVASGLQPGQGQLVVLRIVNDGSTFEDSTSRKSPGSSLGGPGAFYVRGNICADLTVGNACDDPIDTIGVFHCWGWMANDGLATVVSQEYILDGQGAISVQGVEAFNKNFIPRSVVGGTGKFRNIRGEMVAATFFDGGEFLATFDIIG